MPFDIGRLQSLYELGGPIVALLIFVSVIASTVILVKLWQFRRSRIGSLEKLASRLIDERSGRLHPAVEAEKLLSTHRHALVPSVRLAASGASNAEAEAEAMLERHERGFKFLDQISQLAPLLGLLGTVIGMIAAFRALEQAGSNVDPSVLAGGIWSALLTTAAGLCVAMPTAAVLAWLESRVKRDRYAMERIIAAFHAARDPNQQQGIWDHAA